MIKFAIFDVGQVCYPYTLNPLNNYLKKHTNDREAFLAKNGIKSFDYKPYMRGEISFSEFCIELCNHCFIPYNRKFEKPIDTAMHAGVGTTYQETLNAMSYLKQNDIQICLLSNALPNLNDTVSSLTSSDKIFPSYQLGLLKPDIEIYKKVLQKLNANPKEVIFIDDKVKNVEAAQSLGIKGIVFNKKQIEQEIKTIIKASTISNAEALKYTELKMF